VRFARISLTLVTAVLGSVPVLAQSPLPFKPKVLSRAVDLYITPRGQKLFETDLERLLLQNGVSLSQGAFDSFAYQAKEPIRLNDLPVPVEAFKTTLGQLRDAIKQWLIGFDLEDPQPKIDVSDIRYAAKFRTFALRVKGEGSSPKTGKRGIVAQLELVIPEIRVDVSSVRGVDMRNDFLGTFGIDGLWAKSSAAGTPFALTMDFLFDVTPKGGIVVEALGIQTNLSEVPIDLGFQKLIFPEITISINNKVMRLNPAPIEKLILDQKPALIGALQSYLTTYLQETVPQTLTDALSEALPVEAREVNTLDPPGLKTPPPLDRKFVWALQPHSAFMHAGSTLGVQLSAFAEDPLRSSSPDFIGATGLVTKPSLDALPADKYDVALVLNPAFVNRILQLSFDRGYFNKVEVGEDDKGKMQTIKISQLPRVSVNTASVPGQARARVAISQATGGWQGLIVKDKIQVSFDIIVRFSRDAKGVDRVVLVKIDEASLIVDTSSVTVPILSGVVEAAVRKEVAKINKQIASKENVLAELPIPSEILGVKIKAAKITTEPKNGFIVLYIEYAK
jgi:hypothetical protein